jgi:hypothetical protein
LLAGDQPYALQGLVAGEIHLRLIQLSLVDSDLRLLNGYLRVDILYARLRLLHGRLGRRSGSW